MSPIPAKVLAVATQRRSNLSEMPDPEWYLEQFRSHIGTIHELFKVCPTPTMEGSIMVDCKRIGRGRRKGWGERWSLYSYRGHELEGKDIWKRLKQSLSCIAHSRTLPWLACSFAWTKMELDKGYSSSGWNF